MRSTRKRDTSAELAVQLELDRRGLRYDVDRQLLPGIRRKADLVFGAARVAVLIDGCFWHGCPIHGTWPKQNADWWRQKIERNRTRDADTNRRLSEAGWRVIRAWAHEDPADVADCIEAAVRDEQATVGYYPTECSASSAG